MSDLFDLVSSPAFKAAQDMARLKDLFDTPALREIQKMTEQLDRLRGLVDTAFVRTHIDGLSRAQAMTGTLAREMERTWPVIDALQQMQVFNDRFVFPAQTLLDQIRLALPDLSSIRILGLQAEKITSIQASVAGITGAWVDAQNSLKSITAVTELHTLAAGLAELQPFSSAVAEVTRTNFGDWTRIVTLPESILTDPVERFDFYRDLGFNDALTDFPAPVFDEILDRSGLRLRNWPGPSRRYDEGLAITAEEDATVPQNNRNAYDIIFHLETRMREFIDSQMTKVFGADWPKRQIPPTVYQDWLKKKALAEKAGQPDYPLIAYADFSHYMQIIERADNWEKVFKAFFHRKTDIQESLVRLAPVRICAMHSRVITQDDHLILNAEARRIFTALGFRI